MRRAGHYISFFADDDEYDKYYDKAFEAGQQLCGESGFGEAACLANACCQWDDGECFCCILDTS